MPYTISYISGVGYRPIAEDDSACTIDNMDQLRRRLALIAIAMAATLGGGTLGFVCIEHYPVFDAFYMTLTTVTTVGYGEIHPLSTAGRVFNSFLILFGVIIMLLAWQPAKALAKMVAARHASQDSGIARDIAHAAEVIL